jgi:hypothetical protein
VRVATNIADQTGGRVGITSFYKTVFIYKESLKTLVYGFYGLFEKT